MIDFPEGRTAGAEKCFGLDEYKALAIIYARYLAAEAQRSLVSELIATVDEKQDALQESADDLAYALSQIEAEREAYVVSATTNAELAELEGKRKKAWKGIAIAGLVVSLALGAVVTGMGVAR